jgi:hypothetical protein
MTYYQKSLQNIFPVKMVEGTNIPIVEGIKFFKTQSDISLYENYRSQKNNLEFTVKELIREIVGDERLSKELKTESGKFIDTDDFLYYFNNSISFIIYQIHGINITNLLMLPYAELTANQFYEKALKNSSGYIDKLNLLIKFYSNPKPTNECFAKSMLKSPYRLNGNYNYLTQMKEKFEKFSNGCQKFIKSPSSNNTNLEAFFGGEKNFTRLVFEASESCVRNFFDTLHREMKINDSIIKCPKQINNKFLSNHTVLHYKNPHLNTYTPLNYLSFGKVKPIKCTGKNHQFISDAIKELK